MDKDFSAPNSVSVSHMNEPSQGTNPPSMSPQSWLQQPQQPKQPGKLWWIATAVCHVLDAFVFAAGVGACIH